MKRIFILAVALSAIAIGARAQKTSVSIAGDSFLIDGVPTYKGRVWNGHLIEGLLLNARMVQGVFDDANPETIRRWSYPDTGKWDPDRNTTEFIAGLKVWRARGLLSFTINFQGGSPEGYSRNQIWDNNAFAADGALKPAYAARMKRILDAADDLGMVPIVGYFYFGQSPRLQSNETAIRAADNATRWLLDGGWKNLLIEINNESNPTYQPSILRPERVSELIVRVKNARGPNGRRFLVGTSFGGGLIPATNVVAISDFVLIHGNGVGEPARISELVRRVRALPTYRTMPILFNEDDHFEFDKPMNNFVAAVSERASWGYFDYRMQGETFDDGYQSVPVNWQISSPRKRAFFDLLAEIAGAK